MYYLEGVVDIFQDFYPIGVFVVFWSFTCFGVTVKLSMLKFYLETSKMESAFINMGEGSLSRIFY